MSTQEESIEVIPSLGRHGVPQSWCVSEIKVQKVDYVWEIHHVVFHLTEVKNNSIRDMLMSPLFPSIAESNCKWSLGIKFNCYVGYTMIELYLNHDKTSKCKNTMTTYNISLLNEKRQELKAYKVEIPIKSVKGSSHRIGQFSVENDGVLSSTDKLTIYCEVTFSELDPVNHSLIRRTTIKHNSNVSESAVAGVVEDIEQLLENETLSDFVISVKDRDYKVHKTILGARSTFFAAMFKHESLQENQQNRMNILDFDEEVVNEMINYIYTGKSKNLKRLATDLLAISDKYGLDGLKVMSENAIINNVSAENVVDLLLTAKLHRACNLKTYAINFLVAKLADVKKTTAWKTHQSNPELYLEVIEAMSKHVK